MYLKFLSLFVLLRTFRMKRFSCVLRYSLSISVYRSHNLTCGIIYLLPLLPSIIQSSRIAPPSESTVNNFPFGTFPVNLRFPVADTYLYVSPCLDVCPVQVLLNTVQRLVHGLQYHQQVAGRTGRCARGIQHEVAHRLIEVFSLVGDVPYCLFVDGSASDGSMFPCFRIFSWKASSMVL